MEIWTKLTSEANFQKLGELIMTEHKPAAVRTNIIWRQAWRALVDQKWTITAVIIGFIAIPQLLSEWILTTTYQQALLVIEQLKSAQELNIVQILETLSSGMFFLLFGLGINFIFFCMAYIILVRSTLEHLNSQPVTPLKNQLKVTLRYLPKTAIILFFIFFAYLVVQATLPPLILLVSPIMMAPVLYLGSSRPMLRSIRDAASLKYLKASGLPKLSIYFILLGYVGFLILSIYTSVWLSDYILNFDVFFPFGFSFVNQSIGNTPISPAHLIFEVFFVHAFGFAMTYFITLKVCFFFFTDKLKQRLPSRGLAI